MPVPPEAGSGEAKAVFSFDAWKEGRVAPSTITLPIVEPKEEKQVRTKESHDA